MKRVLALSLTIALSLLIFTSAAAQLPLAMPNMDLTAFEGVPGFTLDELSGDFSITSLAAEALKRSIARGELRASSGCAVMYLEIRGNAKTGLYAPVLTVAYAGTKRLNASALSVRVGDIRYDFNLVPDGDEVVEQYAAQLDAAGVEALHSAAGEGATIRLHGEGTYTTRITPEKATAVREQLQNHSLACLNLTEELAALGFSDYRFFDENAESWWNKYGIRPMFSQTDLSTEIYPTGKDVPALDTAMQMLSSDGNNASLNVLRKKLYDMRLLTDTAPRTTASTALRNTIEDLQGKYGLVKSGSVDGTLLSILYGESEGEADVLAEEATPTVLAADAEVVAQTGEAYSIEDVAELALNRYWIAGRAMTSKPTSALSYQDVLNTDHLLLIADGEIVNLLPGEMSLSRTFSASYALDGKYVYPATIKCESDGGERMDSSLLPLGRSRIFIFAEAPQSALDVDGAWTLTVECEGRTLVYELE